METIRIPLIIRGKVIEDNLITFDGRRGEIFETPDVKKYISEIVLRNPSEMLDMYDLSFTEVADYIDGLRDYMTMKENPYVLQSYETSCKNSGLTPAMLRHQYEVGIPHMLNRDNVLEIAEHKVGMKYFDDWVPHKRRDGRIVHIRPFGARTVHVNAGNSPLIAVQTLLRNAITRGDAIVKSPSNDPMIAAAIGLAMIKMAPDHPLTKHYSVAYWKGGNEEFEQQLYRPNNIEKIVAWGGFASMKHITKYLQPGIELVAMDPKLSGSIVGADALKTDDDLKDVARRLAADIGKINQEGCVNARVVYVQSGTDEEGLKKLNKLGEYTYQAIQDLPENLSDEHPSFSKDLRYEINALRHNEWYKVIGAKGDEGAIIVSQINEPVDFEDRLSCRVGNLVPIDDIEEAIAKVTIHTQTIGVYPESLKKQIRTRLAFHGGQRLVTLGHAIDTSMANPHDAIEPLRRMCRWVIDEEYGADFKNVKWS